MAIPCHYATTKTDGKSRHYGSEAQLERCDRITYGDREICCASLRGPVLAALVRKMQRCKATQNLLLQSDTFSGRTDGSFIEEDTLQAKNVSAGIPRASMYSPRNKTTGWDFALTAGQY